jgi:hypothetical protein
MPYRKQVAARKATGHRDKRASHKANIMISVRLPSDLFEQVRDIAAIKRQSMSYTIYEMVMAGVDQ